MSSAPKTTLGLFVDKLLGFFRDLSETYPEEKEIKMALEAIEGAKKVNPRLILDLFQEYVGKPLHDDILAEDEEKVIAYAHKAMQSQFNDMMVALTIFDKHWPDMSDANRKAIWNHLKVLVLLGDRSRA